MLTDDTTSGICWANKIFQPYTVSWIVNAKNFLIKNSNIFSKTYFLIGCQSKDNSLTIPQKRRPNPKKQTLHEHSRMDESIQHTLAFKGSLKKKKRKIHYQLLSASDHFPPHYENEIGTVLELPYTKVLHVPKPVFNSNKRISNCRYV